MLNFEKLQTTKVSIASVINFFDRFNFGESKLFIIIDEVITKHHSNIIKHITLKFNTNFIYIKANEKNKSLKTYDKICNKILNLNPKKSDYIIGIGGGMVTDIAGFIASTLLRGINLINIPTTLLCMVDACIGGKNGVNFNFAKNQIGTIYHPKLIVLDFNFLTTLPKKIIHNSYSEILKYHFITDEALEFKNQNVLILQSLKIKDNIVSLDPNETNIRKNLNFGHTLGHALESYYNFSKSMDHGKAVAYGILYAAKLSSELFGNNEVFAYIKNMLNRFQLPLHLPKKLNAEKLIHYMQKDKKNENSDLTFILLEKIGKPVTQQVNIKTAIRILELC